MAINRTLAAGLILLAVIGLAALAGPLLVDTSLANVGAVIPRQAPSGEYLLGTDGQGREVAVLPDEYLSEELRSKLCCFTCASFGRWAQWGPGV